MNKNSETQAGGASTIRGINYQMLWSLLQTSTLYIESAFPDADAHDPAVQVVLEPKTGGDLLIIDGLEYHVQQLKSKATGGAWSLRGIVHEVLPDLYRSIDFNKNQVFEFVTEGHMGEWSAVAEFFKRLEANPPVDQDQTLNVLSDSATISFGGVLSETPTADEAQAYWSTLTERELFQRIVAIVRTKLGKKFENESEATTNYKVWHLLSRLKYQWNQSEPYLHLKLRRLVTLYTSQPDEVNQTIDQLLGNLAQRAAKGNKSIDAAQFLEENGLRGIPLNTWGRILASSSRRLPNITKGLRYVRDEDVRKTSPEDTQITETRFIVLAGESGQGKTWSLCSLAYAISEDVPVAVLVANGDGAVDIQDAANQFWNNVCHRTSQLGLEAIHQVLQTSVPERATSWLCILIDNVQSIHEVSKIYEMTMRTPGITVIVSVLPGLASAIRTAFEKEARIYDVPSFSEDELRKYLVHDNLTLWHDIPDDVREILCHPLLARLYKTLTVNGQWTPKTEYDLYSEYFNRRLMTPVRNNHPFVTEALTNAMLAVWRGDNYPWTIKQLRQFGFSQDHVQFLLNQGWITISDRGHYRIWHDRLLAWTIAVALAEAIEAGATDTVETANRLAGLLWNDNNPLHLGLGYVPMDLVWLLAQRGDQCADALDDVIGALDSNFQTHRSLYGYFLPTIGERIVPALYRRLSHQTASNSYHDQEIIDAICLIDSPDVTAMAISLLGQNEQLSRACAKVLARRPSPDALSTLWRLYFEAEKDRLRTWVDFDYRKALFSCVVNGQAWLATEIRREPKSSKSTAFLIDLLTKVQDGKSMWLDSKDILRSCLIGEDRRHYAIAVRYFRDSEEISWLIDMIQDEVLGVAAYSLIALIRIDLLKAMEFLPNLTVSNLSSYTQKIIREMWLHCPETLLTKAIEHIHAYGRKAADMYSQALRNRMSLVIFDVVIDEFVSAYDRETINELNERCGVLAKVSRKDLLVHLNGLAGDKLEVNLVDIVIKNIADTPYNSLHAVENIVELLYKIGGNGYTHIINHLIANGSSSARYWSISQAAKRPNQDTIRLLEAFIVSRKPSTPFSVENCQHDAHMALATTGAWKSVVLGFIYLQGETDPRILYARFGKEALNDEDMKPAFDKLVDNPKHQGSILALGFGQRVDWIPFILKTLETESISEYSGLTNACLYALSAMPIVPGDAVPILTPRLGIPQAQSLILDILVHEGSKDSDMVIFEYIRQELGKKFEGGFPMAYIDDIVTRAEYLLAKDEMKEQISELLRQRTKSAKISDPVSKELFRNLIHTPHADSINRELSKSSLLAQAFAQDGPIHHVREKYRSIKALARFDAKEAYEAALRVLHSPDGHDREYVPALMREIDLDRSLDDLFNVLIHNTKPKQADIIARSVARCGRPDFLIDRLSDPNKIIRYNAIRCLGFCEPTNEVLEAVNNCLTDDDINVYDSSITALNRLHNSHWAMELAAEYIVTEDQNHRWLLLDAALETGDLGAEGEFVPDWLQTMCNDQPYLLIEYIKEKVKKRRKKIREQEERNALTEDYM